MLASGSAAPGELLALLGLPLEVVPADVDESVRPGETPVELVRRLALAKADKIAVSDSVRDVVDLTADATVEVADEILGKPTDGNDPRRMLRSLSAPADLVHTAVAVRRNGRTVRTSSRRRCR